MGFLLLAPFFLIRFGLLARLDRNTVARAAHFPPLRGGEVAAYWVYQLSNAAILLCILFLKIRFAPPALFFTGAGLFLAGTALLAASVVGFAAPSEDGVNRGGPYRYSRNPMYAAYFVFFLGCALLLQSRLLLGLVLVFQTAAHWIIRSEERWCLERFGESYRRYMREVRRYF